MIDIITRERYRGLVRSLVEAEQWDAQHGFMVPGDSALGVVLHLDVARAYAELFGDDAASQPYERNTP